MGLLKYIIFSFLITLCFYSFSFAQNDSTLYAPVKEREPIHFLGLKFGANIGRFSDYLFKPDRVSYEGSFDFNLNHKYFGLIEAGYAKVDILKDNYHYKSDGYFYKIGFEYNMLKKQPTDFLGVGIKFGVSNFSHSASDVVISIDHWGDFDYTQAQIDDKMYWAEATLGVKGELFKNIYFGWSALVKVRLSGASDYNFQAYNVPGFGNSSKSLRLGANYYIYYQIPFNRNK